MKHDPRELLLRAAEIIEQRGQNYGGIESNFKLIADIATLKMGREFHPYEICRILECVKDARTFSDPTYLDNDLDNVNYRLFATQFANDYVAWRATTNDVFYRNKEGLKQVATNDMGGAKKRSDANRLQQVLAGELPEK